MPSLSNIFLFILIHQQQKIKQVNCFFSLFNKYLKRCDVHVCNMIAISFVLYVNFPLSVRYFFRLFLFHNNQTQRKVFVLNNKDTSDLHVYAYIRVSIHAYVRITVRVCVYKNTHMCVLTYAYVRINIRACAYIDTRMCVYNASAQ